MNSHWRNPTEVRNPGVASSRLASLLGGLDHTLPLLLPDVRTALLVACSIVAVE